MALGRIPHITYAALWKLLAFSYVSTLFPSSKAVTTKLKSINKVIRLSLPHSTSFYGFLWAYVSSLSLCRKSRGCNITSYIFLNWGIFISLEKLFSLVGWHFQFQDSMCSFFISTATHIPFLAFLHRHLLLLQHLKKEIVEADKLFDLHIYSFACLYHVSLSS